MKVYVDKDDYSDLIVILAVAESEDVIGDVVKEVRPGDVVFGKPYDEWVVADSPVDLE